MAEPGELAPPKDNNSMEDPGAHELASSESDDAFSDARSAAGSRGTASPIPKTRVEKVDDEPSYGEVPGTEAYRKREGDAEPDEVAVVSELPSSIAGFENIPKTVVEEAPGDPGPHSAEFERMREADAKPDVVLDSEGELKYDNNGGTSDGNVSSATQTPEALSEPQSSPGLVQTTSITFDNLISPAAQASTTPDMDENGEDEDEHSEDADDEPVEEDDFGDDFDDFEEGNEDDGFEGFEDSFKQSSPPSLPIAPQLMLPFPLPDFDGLSPDEVVLAIEPFMDRLFPLNEVDLPTVPPLPRDQPTFLTPRSASLWSQLAAPPPLAPPDWIRSRTRRLFLVSLGVPVDLDEILPASKQKKLVLPSLQVPGISPRRSSESRSVSRVRQGEANASTTSVDTQGKTKKRKGPPPVPVLDLVAGRYLCVTTDEALDGMTDEELKDHSTKLAAMEIAAKEVLEYWKKRTDEKIGDREAFEGVIENLVKHARKVRK